MTMTRNTRAALLMTFAMGGYAANDAAMKMLGVDLPLGQLLFWRGMITSLLVGVVIVWRGLWRVRLDAGAWRRVGWRTAGEVGAQFFFISALINMPLANATAVLQALPLTVALAAALFLKEPLGWRRILAIVIGFLGVLLIVRPGPEGFNAYTISAIIGVGFITLRDVTTRVIPGTVPTMVVVLFASLGGMLLGLAMAPWENWLPMSGRHFGLLMISSLFVLLGYVLIVQVMRLGDAGVTGPFRYTSLLWALILGYVVFGEWPTPLTMLGAAIVVATGIFTFYRERALAGQGND